MNSPNRFVAACVLVGALVLLVGFFFAAKL